MVVSLDQYCFMSVYSAEIGDSVNSQLVKSLLEASPYFTKNDNSNHNSTSFAITDKKDLICGRGEFSLVRSIDFAHWNKLETIRIGSYSFKNLGSMELIGLPNLQSVELEYSGFPFFDDRTYDELEHPKKPFCLRDCPKVTYFALGTETLSSFTSLIIESENGRVD